MKLFFSKVEEFTNSHAYSIGLGVSYGHKFKPIELHELVNFDRVVVKDGVRGDSFGAMYCRWVDGSDYDEVIAESLNHSRWMQIKRTVKLNNNATSPKRGEPGYYPAYKLDLLYRTLVHNVNRISWYADSDQCSDETTWGYGGYGEAGSGLLGSIMVKPGVSKGGQLVIISDVNRMWPRAYMYRHKLHKNPTGWIAAGPLEVRRVVEEVIKMVIDK